VALNSYGEHIVTSEEVVELDTPYIVRVAVLKSEYGKVLASEKSAGKMWGRSPMDTEVLSYIYR
jgi:hypothetical protein